MERPAPSAQRHRRPRLPGGLRSLASLAALGAVASAAMLTTQATLTDQVTMAQITVSGGTLDMVANGDADDTAVGWTGSLAVALDGLSPGDERSGTVEIDNVGDLPFTLAASVAGTDASGCFSYYLRETGVTGGSGAGSFPVQLAGMGTATGSDASTAAFATPLANVPLPDVGADVQWEPGDSKVYTMTVRMRTSCSVNNAAGDLDVTFDATQV